jgi:hypothetical protein
MKLCTEQKAQPHGNLPDALFSNIYHLSVSERQATDRSKEMCLGLQGHLTIIKISHDQTTSPQ